MKKVRTCLSAFLIVAALTPSAARADIGVGAKPPADAEVLIDGTRETLDDKWTYWEGPGFASSLPIKWKIVDDPVDEGTVLMTDDPAAAGGKFGAADIVTKKEYRDFRLHIEFLVMQPGGNSGVYLQNRYEIQVLDGDKTAHGMGAVINEAAAPYDVYNGTGKWNAYDIMFRAARFGRNGRSDKALVTMYFNGRKVHDSVGIRKVWGGPNSGIDGGNEDGTGITDTPGGLKLQCEGHDVRFRNTWIREVNVRRRNTDFTEPIVISSLFPDTETPLRLFNEQDLSGWNGDTTRWSVVDGMIRGANQDDVPTSTYLLTENSYRNFRLLFEVKQTMGDRYSTMHSAVAMLGKPFNDQGDAYGFKGPLLMFCNDWGIWDAYGRNRVVERGAGPTAERRGDWNLIEMLVIGDRIRMAANGLPVVDFTDDPANLQASPLGLQLHSNHDPQEYHFRGLVVSEDPEDHLVTLSDSAAP